MFSDVAQTCGARAAIQTEAFSQVSSDIQTPLNVFQVSFVDDQKRLVILLSPKVKHKWRDRSSWVN